MKQKNKVGRRNKKHKSVSSEYKEIQRRIQKYSKAMKRNPSSAERVLQQELIDNGIDFKFQVHYWDETGRGYIVDFLFPRTKKNKLAIEIDGKSHNGKKAETYDIKRTEWLVKNRNLEIIRFENDEVINDPQSIVSKIVEAGARTKHDLELIKKEN